MLKGYASTYEDPDVAFYCEFQLEEAGADPGGFDICGVAGSSFSSKLAKAMASASLARKVHQKYVVAFARSGSVLAKEVDAPYAASPSHFAEIMINRESELYPELKMRSSDNTWGLVVRLVD